MEKSALCDQDEEASKPTFLHPGERRRGVSATGKREANFLQKLRCRETSGVVRSSANPRDPEIRFFSRLPGRLAFCLRDAIPFSAIESGHVFLGFSKCGQFLLSYTQTETDIVDLMSITAHLQYHYRLHWWLFVPYSRAKKVAEISLFSNGGAAGNLHLSFCQWPYDASKVLVYGCQVNPEEVEETPSRPCYITVTAVPALNACQDCAKVAASYEEDEMAAAWNSCVRLSCLEHGMTVHTTFDLVPPYPKFEPRVSLKRDSGVVINSGNLLHYLNFELEEKPKRKQVSAARNVNELRVNVNDVQPSLFSPLHSPSVHDSDGDSAAVKAGLKCYPMNPERLERVAEFVDQLSPPHLRKPSPYKRVMVYENEAIAGPSTAADDDDHGKRKKLVNEDNLLHYLNFELEEKSKRKQVSAARNVNELRVNVNDVQPALFSPLHSPSVHDSDSDSAVVKTGLKCYPMNPERLERVAEFVDQLSPPHLRKPSPYKRVMVYENEAIAGPSTEEDDNKRKKLADQAYEINDDNFNEGIIDKLSTFRKKRLADKKYEFTEDENVTTPLMTLRQPVTLTPKKNEGQVLKPLDGNTPSKKSPSAEKFHAKFTRRFIELDDELVSVMSGIEFDDDGVDVGYQAGGGYHSALPLEVHGAGYQALTMISNLKAEKLNKKCVKVQQNSLDVDWFCHDMAQKLCAAAGKKYWYCNDYDVEVVDLDPASGDVICVAVVLVTATFASDSQSVQISALQRHLHQGTLKFCWNVDTGHCRLIDSEPLKELCKEPHGIWHPARNISLSLQKTWGVLGPHSGVGNIRCFTNESVIRGTSLKTIVDTDHLVAIILDDLE